MRIKITSLIRWFFKIRSFIRRTREEDYSAAQSYERIDERSEFKEVVKGINEESNRLITWSLGIIAGSMLMLIGADFTQPTGWILYFYFLFVVGWICLGISILYGVIISRNRTVLADNKTVRELIMLHEKVDEGFRRQIFYLYIGFIPLLIWLAAFLLAYVFDRI